jgi:ketosteroid isomerase-like protein
MSSTLSSSSRLWLLFAITSCAAGGLAQAQAADDPACQVWQRELSFAHSVQRHDAAGFAAHVAADAVFDANTATPTRGRDAIGRQWAGFIDGRLQRLDWYPQQVVVTDGGRLAYSSGSYLYEHLAPGAKQHDTIGHFATTWLRGSDRIWRVVFDGGDAGNAATAAEVAAFHAGRRSACPQASDKP